MIIIIYIIIAMHNTSIKSLSLELSFGFFPLIFRNLLDHRNQLSFRNDKIHY